MHDMPLVRSGGVRTVGGVHPLDAEDSGPVPPPDPAVAGRVPAWKVARIVVADDGSFRFAGLAAHSVQATFYDNEASAHCSKGRSHQVPAWDCSCGFHVARHLEELSSMYEDWDQPMFALLEVEVWGGVVEHDHGLRAQHQRVLGVRLAGNCTFCGEPSRLLAAHYAAPAPGMRYGATDLIHLVPACDACNRRECLGRQFTRAELAGKLGVEVTDRQCLHLPQRRTTPRWMPLRDISVTMLGVLAGFLALTGSGGDPDLWSRTILGAGAVSGLSVVFTRSGSRRRLGNIFAWTCGVATATGLLLGVSAGSAPQTIGDAPTWYDSAVDLVRSLPTDPLDAAQVIAGAGLIYDAVPVGADGIVTGLAAATSYALSPSCVVLGLDGSVLLEQDGPLGACLAAAQEAEGGGAEPSP